MATIIQIKRSTGLAAPTINDLVEGELAYSEDKSSDGAGARLYIESLDSSNNEVVHIVGGKYYTDKVDASTSLNTANTLVQRDTSGNFSANTITANKFVGDLQGNITGTVTGEAASANIASFANVLTTPRNITLVGDVTGTVLFSGASDVTMTTTANINSVQLGTDTTGDYVGNVTAGTGVTITGTPAEGWTPTISIGQPVGTTSSVTFSRVTAPELFGNANTATKLATARFINLTGDASGSASFDGTGNADIAVTINANGIELGTDTTGDYVANVLSGTGINVTGQGGETANVTVNLTNTGVVATTYGSATNIPVITVDAQGRITSAANSSISTSFTLAADTGTPDTFNTGDTLRVSGGAGIDTSVTDNTFTVALETSGAAAGNYGSTTQVPKVTVDTHGRITSVSNADITAQLVGDTGSGDLNLSTETLAVKGGTGVSTSLSGNTFTITNDGVVSATSGGYGLTVSSSTGAITITNTGVTRAIAGTGIGVDTNNGNITFTNTGVVSLSGTADEISVSASNGSVQIGLPDDVTIGRNLTVSGNLNVLGNVTTVGTVDLKVDDPLIYLAGNNYTSDLVDIGFIGNYFDGSSQRHAGLFRDASETDGKTFKLFYNLQPEPTTGAIDTANASFKIATLTADLLASNANVTTALSFGNEKHQILPLSSSVLEVRGGLGDASGALSLAAGNYPTSYSKIYLESGKKITLQADEAYVTLFNDGNTKLITMNTTHTAATSTSTGALRVAGGVGITGNIFANYFNGKIDGGTF